MESNNNSAARPILLLKLKEEISGILAETPWQQTGRNAKTLAKYGSFRIVLTALKQGSSLEEHRAKGCISIQLLEGRVRVTAAAEVHELSQGELLALDHAVPHAVQALEDSIFLITMSFIES
jgi:quercetin dioxygenase-like cupin family protein